VIHTWLDSRLRGNDKLKFAALEISSAALMLGGKQQKYSIFKH
jgi:hypothetical protein